MKEIDIRRSVRTFENKEVSKEYIDKILKAAMQAPSAKNQQPWYFIVVDKRELLDEMSIMASGANLLKHAPLAIICLYDKNILTSPDFVYHDMGALTQNILLEVTHLNLGAVWIGGSPRKERVDHIRTMFNLEENIVPFSIVAIGYPNKESKGNYYINRYDENRVKYNKW